MLRADTKDRCIESERLSNKYRVGCSRAVRGQEREKVDDHKEKILVVRDSGKKTKGKIAFS